MNSKTLLKNYTRKIKIEAIMKSCIFAAIIAFCGCFLSAFVTWFFEGFQGLWLSLGILAGLFAIVFPIVYFKKYRPTVKDAARRLDRLGLYEQMITMTELEGDTSIMAVHQREAAVKSLDSVTGKMLKFAVSGLSIVALAVSCVFGISMITVEALSYEEKLPSGGKVISVVDPANNPDVYYTVKYVVRYFDKYGFEITDASGCAIDGNEEQLVLAGTDAEPVLAYCEEDMGDEWFWYFYGWYDVIDFTVEPDSQDAYREDLAVTLDSGEITVDEDGNYVITHYAAFLQVEYNEDGDGDGGDGDAPGEDGDAPSDAPGEDGDGGDGDSGEGEGDGVGGGPGDENENKIIDGDEDYRSHMDEYTSDYNDNSDSVPDDYKGIIDAYYGIIE